MIYVIFAAYKPNQAPTNRMLALMKGFDELAVEASLVFLYPSIDCDRLGEGWFKHIKVEYLWDKRKWHNKYYKYLCSFIDARRFAKTLQAGDSVLLFGGGGYVHYFTAIDGVKVYQERTEHPMVNPLELPFMQKRYIKHIPDLDGVFVISYGLKRVMEEYGAKNVYVVNMLVDSTRFENLKKTSTVKYIAYCGTASNNKDGVDDLIKAFAIVVKSHPEVTLKIMGKAPTKDDESGNLRLVEDLGVKDKVEFMGVVKAQDMPQMLKNATIVALARPDSIQARCGFPTKLGEYLLSENPAVVTKVGDIPLFLRDKETALLSQDKSPKHFASKIIWALEHPQEASEIGRQGAQVALREFNYLTEAKKVIEAITGRIK